MVNADVDERSILVMNDLPPPTAIFRYAHDIHSCLPDQTRLFNIVYDEQRWKGYNEDSRVNGRFHMNKYLNFFLRSYAFSDIISLITRAIRSNGIIHYAYSGIRPFTHDISQSVVTIHDNPNSLLNTDMYSTGDNGTIEHFLHRNFIRNQRANIQRYTKFDFVLCDSNYVRNALIKFGFGGRIEVIFPPVSQSFYRISDKDALRFELGLPTDKILVLSVSSNVKRKNLKMVKQVMDDLGNQFKLVRIGFPVAGSLSFTNISDELVNKVYNACDLLLFPTLEEGFGYPIPEAFYTGLPVVSSDIEVVREVAGNAALLADPLDKNEIKRCVKEAQNARDDLILKGLARLPLFDSQHFKARLTELYSAVLN